jgi:hypothetical protein
VTRHPLHTLDLDSSQMREQHSKIVIIAPDGSSLLIAWLRVSIHHEMWARSHVYLHDMPFQASRVAVTVRA